MVSFDELYLFDHESNYFGSGYGSPDACAIPSYSVKAVGSVGKSIGHVYGMGSGVFVLIVIESIGDLIRWSCLYQEDSSPKMVDL